jgi:hypothetical protein
MKVEAMHEWMRWHLRFSSTTLLQESREVAYTPPRSQHSQSEVPSFLADTNIPWSFEQQP